MNLKPTKKILIAIAIFTDNPNFTKIIITVNRTTLWLLSYFDTFRQNQLKFNAIYVKFREFKYYALSASVAAELKSAIVYD